MASKEEDRLRLTATFTPGGMDDYYMPTSPDVVSPAPQRIIQELSGQIQENLRDLENHADNDRNSTSTLDQTSATPGLLGASHHLAIPKPADAPITSASSDVLKPGAGASEFDQHVFPVLKNRTSNVPPSDKEKASVLESARLPVLGSPDPEVQLMWAQDALTFSDISSEHYSRLAHTTTPRPSTPSSGKQLSADAVSIVSFLADQGHPKAEFLKGMWLEFGKFGCAQDKAEAFRSYKRATEKGYARAEYRMGMMFESTNQPQDALTHYRAGEAAGDAASCYRLGMMSLLGQLGQPQDFVRALTLIHYAADHADENAPQGAYVYGMLLAKDLTQVKVPDTLLPLDNTSARAYLERAAFLGFSKAQLKMGSAYELCTLGCDFNPALSLHYNQLAARQGEPEAEMAISKWFLCGYQDLFTKNEEVAYKYAERASADGLATAEFALGYFHEIGMYVPVNLDKALQWYRKAAQNGSRDAEARIEAVSMQRTLSKKDHERIAIQRIQSTHASKRGGRPTNLPQTEPRPDLPSKSHELRQATVLPAPQETAPYPLTDQPSTKWTGATPYTAHSGRSASVAPYPTHDGPGLSSSVTPSPPRFAPYDSQPQLTVTQGRTISGTRPMPNSHNGKPPMPPVQASSSRPNMPTQRIPVGSRASPGPSTSPRPQHEPTRQQGLRRPDSRADTYIGPPAADARKHARTPDFTGRPTVSDAWTGSAATNRGRQPGSQPNSDTRAHSASSALSGAQAGLKVPAKPGAAVRIERLPGKGPSTFDEMGIPKAAKGDGDCVVM